jgi:hypothetical protein
MTQLTITMISFSAPRVRLLSVAALLLLLSATIPTVTAHGVIIAAEGDAGGQGTALAVDSSTPRDGTRRRPFQQDTTRFEDADDEDNPAVGATGCGETLQNGEINIATAMQQVISESGGLPQVSQGGQVIMTLHQVNADGAGPYACMVDGTGSGASFVPMAVSQNVPGDDGRDRDGSATDFVSAPALHTCATRSSE